MLEFVEEALDQVAVAIEEWGEGGMFVRLGMGLTLAHAPRAGEALAQGVGVVGAVGEQDVAWPSEPSMSSALRPSWAWPSVSLSTIGRP